MFPSLLPLLFSFDAIPAPPFLLHRLRLAERAARHSRNGTTNTAVMGTTTTTMMTTKMTTTHTSDRDGAVDHPQRRWMEAMQEKDEPATAYCMPGRGQEGIGP